MPRTASAAGPFSQLGFVRVGYCHVNKVSNVNGIKQQPWYFVHDPMGQAFKPRSEDMAYLCSMISGATAGAAPTVGDAISPMPGVLDLLHAVSTGAAVAPSVACLGPGLDGEIAGDWSSIPHLSLCSLSIGLAWASSQHGSSE